MSCLKSCLVQVFATSRSDAVRTSCLRTCEFWRLVRAITISTCRCGRRLSWHKSCSQRSNTSGTCSRIFLESLSSACCNLDHNTWGYIHPYPGMSCYTVDPEYLSTQDVNVTAFLMTHSQLYSKEFSAIFYLYFAYTREEWCIKLQSYIQIL